MPAAPVLPQVLPLREASRVVVRELGFLQNRFSGTSAAECHALLELERCGMLTGGELAEALAIDKSTASRTAAALVRRRWARRAPAGGDGRRKPLVLTAAGRGKLRELHAGANQQVNGALGLLTEPEREAVARGMRLYAKALGRSRRRREHVIRRIARRDDPSVAALIRLVMPQFGASGPGYAIEDPEVDFMSRAYRGPRAAYWVVEHRGRVVGGGGFAQLAGADHGTAELRKMYFLPESRGLGLGAELLALCIAGARRAGFRVLYLETLESMTAARRLYESFGFRRLCKPAGHTGHFGCDWWYALELGPKARENTRRGAASAPAQRSAGVKPVRRAILASMRGPISTPS